MKKNPLYETCFYTQNFSKELEASSLILCKPDPFVSDIHQLECTVMEVLSASSARDIHQLEGTDMEVLSIQFACQGHSSIRMFCDGGTVIPIFQGHSSIRMFSDGGTVIPICQGHSSIIRYWRGQSSSLRALTRIYHSYDLRIWSQREVQFITFTSEVRRTTQLLAHLTFQILLAFDNIWKSISVI